MNRAAFEISAKIAGALAALMLGGCAPAAQPRHTGPDIVASGAPIALGTGWYSYETYAGQSFRWVNNDAKFTVSQANGDRQLVSFLVEAGPGIGRDAFTLDVRGASGTDVATEHVLGRQRVSFDLPVQPNQDQEFELHVDGGGKPAPRENRILNFRVFKIDELPPTPPMADIVDQSEIRLGRNWGVLEQYAGQTFRWVDNDSEIDIDAPDSGSRRLMLDVAAGPAVDDPANFALKLTGAPGVPAETVRVKAAGTAAFAVALHKGANVFRLHVDSTGRSSKNDKRVLNFRVFKILMP